MNTISRKTLGLLIGLFIVTGILLYMAIMPRGPKSSPVTTTLKPTPTSVAHSTLAFAPDSVVVTAGVAKSLDIQINTGENDVRAVQLELAYDPLTLTNVSLKGGNFFANPTELLPPTVNLKTGRISYWIGVQTPRRGTGTVAILSFTPKSISQTPITSEVKFIPLTKIAAAGVGPSVLKTSSDLKLTIQSNSTLPQASSPSAMTTTTPKVSTMPTVIPPGQSNRALPPQNKVNP